MARTVTRAKAGAALLLSYGAAVFLSAFLLFQVQPLIGRFILPWFGATSGVWATCMLFFQALLLLGYSYAHFVVSRWTPRRQAVTHASLLLLAALTLPITPDVAWKPIDSAAPITRILTLLAVCVGAPYLLLSSTGPLLQGWFARLAPGLSPYRLYALSNLGSLLALLSYPVLVEPNLRLEQQTLSWSFGFVLFALLCALCAWLLARDAPETSPVPSRAQSSEGPAPGARDLALWVALATCGSTLLLATTNQLSIDVAIVPFLWVLPLSLYLLSFVFCFDHDRWYVRPLFCALLPIVLINVVRVLEGGIDLDILDQLLSHSALLFVGCMCCHGEMARRRPAPQHLTVFFLMLAIGGVFGGFFVAIVSPTLFSGFYEYPIALVACYLLVSGVVLRDLDPSTIQLGELRRLRVPVAAGWGLCLLVVAGGTGAALFPGSWVGPRTSPRIQALFADWQAWMHPITLAAAILPSVLALSAGLAGLGGADWRRRLLPRAAILSLLSVGGVALAGSLLWIPQYEESQHMARERNFYGVLAIKDYDDGARLRLALKHGGVRHGIQLNLHPGRPTTYYGPPSGVGLAIQYHPARLIAGHEFRIGVIGLGAGTLAAYANASIDIRRDGDYVREERRDPPDLLRFYELNPLVLEWAEEIFTFISDARRRGARIDTLVGDARIVLERQLAAGEPQRYDVLVVDAFTGDAIPIHLLTRESLRLYFAHLRHAGVLALHVSNRYVRLEPVVHRLALELKASLLYAENSSAPRLGYDRSMWMLLTRNDEFLAHPRVRASARALPPPGPLWTDDFSSIFDVIDFD